MAARVLGRVEDSKNTLSCRFIADEGNSSCPHLQGPSSRSAIAVSSTIINMGVFRGNSRQFLEKK